MNNSILPKAMVDNIKKMYPPGTRTMTKAKHLKQSSLHWMDWGMMSHSRCLTAKILKFPNPEIVCTLSDVLEKNVAEKYFLLRRQVQKLLYKGNFTQGVRVYSADGTSITPIC